MKRINILILVAAIAFTTYGFIRTGDNEADPVTYAAGEGTNVGDKAPDLKYENTEGQKIALSSLKGKVVLIDFWASWCGPCRAENPNVVEAYKKYKDLKFKDAKGFEIFSFSLDKNLEQWKQAIKKDNLYWPYHASDLMGWNSAGAALYGVQSIPTNFLIDAKGIIVAKNLRGPYLDMELQKLLDK